MTELSLPTLALAITSTVAERQRLLARIAQVAPEVDADEHLSESVMDIDRALGELGSTYDALDPAAAGYPDYHALRAVASKG